MVLTADCPPDWPADLRLGGFEAILADVIAAARAVSGQAATRYVTTDQALAHGLAGLARCLQIENPGAAVQVVLARSATALSQPLADEILVDARNPGAPLYRRFHLVDALSGWQPKGHIIVTGGNGAIARLVCHDILAKGTVDGLTLIGRNGPRAETAALLARAKAQGVSADWIADPGAGADSAALLAAALTKRRALAGPIAAVLHCAGVTADGLLASGNLPPLDAVLRPKLDLARDLDAATAQDPISVFAGFSSLASVAGNEGQGLYAFANGMLDGMLAARDALVRQGLRRGQSVALNWGYWEAGGMRLGAQTLASLQDRDGVSSISTNQGLSALWAALGGTAGQVSIAAGDPDRILTRLNRPAAPPVTVQAAQADPALQRAVARQLCAVLAAAGGRDPAEIDPIEPFSAYGVDSLMIVEVMQRLRPVFGDLPSAAMFEHGSVDRLALWLSQAHRPASLHWTGGKEDPLPAAGAVAQPVASGTAPPPCDGGPDDKDIVIVGMAGRFPAAGDTAQLWQNLLAAHDAISDIPADRWDVAAMFDPDPSRAHAGFSYARWGGFLPDFADFDPSFFGMTPREAAEIDPQERLFLMTAWHAVEDAGLTPALMRERLGGAVGVFAGVTKSDHARLGARRHGDGSVVHPRASFSSVANRVSFVMDLHGPSVPVDTMCSSSMTALHQARMALLHAECALALVGGVNLYQHPSSYAELCQSAMLAKDGRCRSFGAGGSGFVPGEGVACLVLTTRDVARRLGLRIDAVLRATAVNHGGTANGYTVPNPATQRALVENVLRSAGCTAKDIGLVEAHGTGTALGDPIEVESLTGAFGPLASASCALGSIKSNIGHLEAAAGVVGVVKVVLQLRHGRMVPTLHSTTPNPDIDFARSPFRLVHRVQDWTGPRRALVNSFGAGGANGCALIEGVERETARGDTAPNLLVLSARSRQSLLTQAKHLLDWLSAQNRPAPDGVRQLLAARLGLRVEDIAPDAALADLGLSPDDLRWLALEIGSDDLTPDSRLANLTPKRQAAQVDLAALCATRQIGRVAHPLRVAFTVASVDDVETALGALLAEPDAAGIVEIAKADRGDLKRLQDHPEFARTIETLLANRDLARLAGLWRRGVDPDWARLYTTRPAPLSLPGTAFDCRRMWLGDLPLADAGASLPRIKVQAAEPRPATPLEVIASPPLPDLAGTVRRVLSQTMDLPEDDIDDSQSFADYGLDSILGIRFVDAINRALGCDIRSTAIFDFPTVQALAGSLAERGIKMPTVTPAIPAVAASAPAPARPVQPSPTVARTQAAPVQSAIAIIGQSGRYAGADDLGQFWRNLMTGTAAVSPVARWPLPDHVRCRTGGFLSGIDRFDAGFFNISGSEARYMDPQQRLFLEESWSALEQAGYVGAAIMGQRCGVYIGCYTGDYQDLFTGEPSPQSLWGNMGSVIPARIAYHLDLKGPALAFDTACSSSLVAVDAACKALRRGEVDMALAGGVFLQATPRLYLAADRAGMLSPTGQSYSFDARADGFVPGEGVGVVVLKRLDDALAAGDMILATIEGSAVNSNGKTNGLIAPSTKAQAALLAEAQDDAGVGPQEIALIEAHGTGTALGDPIEFDALAQVFGAGRHGKVALTSVKPAIGHAQFAAGIASLHKVVLALQHRTIPANLCFDRVNPLVDLAGAGFEVPVVNRPWPQDQARLAGVSSFGASGTNAHVILRAAPAQVDGLYHAAVYPILLSARSIAGLRGLVASLADWVDANPDAALGDVAFTLMQGRMHFERRCGFAVRSLAELSHRLRGWLVKETQPAGEFGDLIAEFVQGSAPRWPDLFPQDRPRRIAVPGAVFERARYWVDTRQNLADAPVPAPIFALTRIDRDTLGVTISPDSAMMRDHLMNGVSILPGFALPELFRQALEQVENAPVVQMTLRDLCWLRPVDASALHDLRVCLGKDNAGGRPIRLLAGETVLAQAQLLRSLPHPTPLVPLTEGEPVSAEVIAARLRAGGIQHGPSLRGVKSVLRHGNRALAKLADPSGQPLPLSPALLDSAVQAAVAFADGEADTMPFSVAEVTLLHPATAEVDAHLCAPRPMGAGTLGGMDIDLCLPDGRVAISLRGIAARPIPTRPAPKDRLSTTQALVPLWHSVTLDAGTAAAPEVVFHPEGTGVPAHLWPTIPRACLHEAADWAHVSRIGLWVGRPCAPLVAAEKSLQAQVLVLMQSLLRTGAEARPLDWTVLTLNALHHADMPASGYGASLIGLFGAMAREYRGWTLRMADIDAAEVGPELSCLPDRRMLMRRSGLWLEQRLERLCELPTGPSPYRDGAVYVVIGGAGGVARIWTEHVLRRSRAQVVWLGRSAPDAQIAAHQDHLATLGPRPAYVQVDARDTMALGAARAEILNRFGRIDGVVHSAITLADGGLAGMDWPRLEAVLSAKLDTLDNMLSVFRSDMRDFGVVFSSLQSFARMPGQANYAAACTFADNHTLESAARHGLPLRVVNWGYWANAGIVATDEHRRRMARFGQLGLDPERALAALDALLTGGPAQMAIAELETRATVTMEAETANTGANAPSLARGIAPPLLSRLTLPDAGDRWRPIHARLGAQMDRFDPEMTDVLAACIAQAGLMHPAGRATMRGLQGIFDKWWEETARVLHAAGYLDANGLPARPAPDVRSAWANWERATAAVAEEPDLRDHVRLASAMLRGLPEILAGTMPATQFMFPEGRFDLVNGVYHGNSVADFFNDLLADAAVAAVQARIMDDPAVRLRLVEVGAGTGGTARVLFRRLAPYAANIAEYRFTDLSKAFLITARQNFLKDAPYLQTQIFDVSKHPQDQGFETGSYDIAVATNVLHATRDILQSLTHTKALLRQNGLLLVNELICKSLFSHLTFGLLDGWWAYDDAAMRLPGTPALASDRWRTVLSLAGFRPVARLCPEAEVLTQQVFIGQSDGVIVSAAQRPDQAEAVVKTTVAPPEPVTPTLTVATPQIDLSAHLRKRLAAAIEVDADRIEDDAPFERYGVDSILVLQIVDALRAEFPKLTSTVLFEANTIARLADHLRQSQPAAVAALSAGALPASTPTATALPVRSLAQQQPALALPEKPEAGSRDVAIIGLAGSFAGSADLDALWQAVSAGETLFRPAPRDGRHWPTDRPLPAGYMDGADRFDPLFFAISPAEAMQMDPQERLFLQTAYHAMENAGYAPQSLSRQGRVAVLAGVMNAHYPTRAAFWSVANRLSFLFDFKGPSLSCDTACSSSAAALVLAMDMLRAGRCDLAIAGGVNVIAHPRHLASHADLGIQSRQGRLRPFSADADGMLSGEGAGVVILKMLDRALADGDRIEGILRGAALGSGGRSSSYTAPSPSGHADIITQALTDAGVAPDAITLIEAHGTGTRLGDPIEVEGLTRALGPQSRAAVGSVKGNIGHTESAAAMAGLFKVLAQMRHETIAPLPDLGRINPEIPADSTLSFPREPRAWPRSAGQPRLAGLSSFGAGGANAHLVIQEPPVVTPRPPQGGVQIVPLSARSEAQLHQMAQNLLTSLAKADRTELEDIAYTLQTGRDAFAHRWAFAGRDTAALEDALRRFTGGDNTRPDHPLARDWVAGAKVDWASLWAGPLPRRLALPAYPFANESYWLAEVTEAPPEPQLAATPPAQSAKADTALSILCQVVGETLGIAPDRLDVTAPLDGYGMDSVMVTRATDKLEAVFGPLPKTLFYECRTLAALAAHLDETHHLPAALQPQSRAAPAPSVDAGHDAIAIIGLAGRYPQAETLGDFWQVLTEGHDCITPIPADRWDHNRFYSETKAAGKTRSRWGGFLNQIDGFDAAFFGILPKDADLTDPQERLFVETAWHAVEDAGHCPETLNAACRVGVFVGVMYSEYQLLAAEQTALGQPTALSSSPASIANRVSYLFDFQGPSLAVDTMCASSLTAIHLAVRALRAGECHAAVAGGVNLSLHPNKYLMMGLGGFEATDGRCRSFGTGGSGYVPSEGVGAIVLKPLSKALADGDPIRGIIRGSAVNHGGRSNGYTVPDPVAQARTISDALADGRIAHEKISYVECHGTGTALGDPIEIAGLKHVFGPDHALAIGSVKSNIGHCESAAGVAGLTKVLLQMQHRQRVASLHSTVLNPDLGIEGTAFHVDQAPTPWVSAYGPLMAGVSSFGAGGSNAHIVIEEPPEPRLVQGDGPVALVLSARSEAQLATMANALADTLERDRPSLGSVAYTLQTGRRSLPHRAGVMAEHLTQAVSALRALAGNLRAVPDGASQQAMFLRRWLAGERVDWASLYPVAPPRVHLPLYPFDRKSYWGVARTVAAIAEDIVPVTGKDAFALFSPVWSPDMNASPLPRPNDRLVVDLTGQLTESDGACLSLPLSAPEDVISALVARLGPVMGQARMPDLVQFALPADAGALVPAVAAFAGTMAQERRALRVQVVELARAWPASGLRTALDEVAPNPAQLIRMAEGGNLVRHLAPLDLPDQPAPVPQGMVVISGGLGGLGQVFAADIARRSPGTPILLLGRRPRDGRIDTELARLGARRMAYRAVDITDADAVAQVLATARADFGPVGLVIHAAGILRDGMLMVKSPADARAVVATKVAGARALDAATRQDPLAGFVLCSSLAGVSGNAGQADYAFGNGWLDGFAAARQGPGQTVSLNWPLWAEGGMTVPEGALKAMRQGFGLAPMPAAEGVSLLWRALGSTARQVVVGWGEPDRITETLDNGSAQRVVPEPVAQAFAPQKAKVGTHLADLATLVADVLRIPVSEVQVDAQLADYGFDSIALADLADQCTTRLGLDVSPALFYSFGTLRQVSAHLAAEAARAEPPPSMVREEAMRTAPFVLSSPDPAPSRAAAQSDNAVAIVGVSAAFPKAQDVESFWQNLKAGRRAITEIPSDRWDWRALMGDPKSEAGKTDIRWGGFLDDIAGFDPLFFGISPREAECMDPHQRLLMTHAWRAIEDAGLAPAALSGSNTAVFMATSASEYAAMARESGLILQQLSPSGVVGSLGPNRISHLLNLGGPSEPVETACSSALVALHRAVEAIRSGCDGAIVGAVNTILMPHGHVSFARSGMLSPDGECRSFAADANGYVRSEGVAVLVLRRLSQARREGLPILGVIRATGVNHGGRGVSLFAPNAEAQARLIADVLGQSGLDPASLTAIEAHGTGTSVGDPIEVEGLKRGFQTAVARHGSAEPVQGQIALSSVKSWIGHCEVSAGMAGLIKLLMEMRDGVLIPDAPRKGINPAIRLAGTPFRLLDGQEAWHPLRDQKGNRLPRRAGISSFGFGGVNAHAVIEEAPLSDQSPPISTGPEVIVLSAQSGQALRATAQALLDWVQARPDTSLTSLATTLQLGRNGLRHRLGFVARSIGDLCDSLSAFVQGRPDGRWVQGIVRHDGAEPARATDPAEQAQAWVKGHAVTWPQRPVGLARLRLPPTAMDMRRCWFAPEGAPALAPRLLAPDDHDSLRYDALFDSRVDFVADHLVQGQPVLPGTAYVAMAHEAGFAHLGVAALSIRDLAFERMAHCALLSPPLHLHLQTGDETGFHIESTAGIHARGRIVAQPSRPARRIDLDALEAQVTERIAGARFYETFARMGLDYGTSFRLIDQAGVGSNFVITRLRQLDDAPALALPPNMADAALQSSLGFVLRQGAGQIPLQVPVKIDTIDIYAPLPSEVVVVAEQVSDQGRQVTNIALCGQDGTVLVDFRGFVTARVGMAPPRTETAKTASQPQQAAALQTRLQEVVSELTHISVSDLDVRADLVEFGLDSVTFHELSARLSAELQREIAPTLFFECPTIAALAERLALTQVAAPVAATLPVQDAVLKVALSAPQPAPVPKPAAKVADRAMQDAVLSCVAQIVHLAPSELALETGLSEIGLDSITFAELASQLSVLLGTEVSPAALYECATVGALVDRFVPTAMPPAPAQPVPQAAAILPVAVAAQPVAAPAGGVDADGFAIIGMSGAFPGAADPETLWRNMIERRDVITRPPSWRWDWQRIDGDPRQAPGKTNIHWGGFIDGLADFDPAFFGLSSAEAEIMDPQQRLMMMHVWAALEAAGHAPRGLGGSRTGLYMGLASASYAMMVGRAGRSTDPRWVMGNVVSMGLNRISHMLDLHGPSEPCETACSSSLVALHRGVEDLRSGVCDMIVAGGVNAMPNEDLHVAFSAAGMLSPDGRCKTFDKDANGYVRAEGIGVVVVRRLADALRDGDDILGVIRATGVRHAGRAVSLTAPNPQSQASLIHEVIDRAGIDPATISFIEAHGTGTALGDPIEVEGLKTAFDAARTANPLLPGFCTIGAVKTHVGHLEMAAGVTGLIKVLLQMRHRQIVGNLHCSTVNPLLRLEGSPFRLAQTTMPWAPRDARGQPLPLRAGVSSFGFGGVNAHVLLDGPPDLPVNAVDLAPQAVILSAATETALRAQVQRLCDWIEAQPVATPTPGLLARIAVTLQDGRDDMAHRLALVVQDVTQLVDSLRAWLTKQPAPAGVGIWSGHAQAKPSFLRAADLALLQSGWAQHRDLACACEAWAAGLAVDWAAFRLMPQRKLSLPTYPFDCKPYWVTPLSSAPQPATVAVAPLPQTAAQVDGGVDDTLRRIAADYLGVEPADLDLDAPLAEHGFDSIALMTVVSRLTAALPDLALGEKADFLLQSSNLRMLAERAAGPDRDETPEKPELLHLDLYAQGQKKDPLNLLIARPVLHLGKSPRSMARLVINETHPLFFDHPLDHVSGLHLAEAICQLTRATELCQNHHDPRAAVFIRHLRFDFPAICAKQPAEVSVRPDPVRPLGYRGEVRQAGVVVAQGQLVFASLDGLPNAPPPDNAIPRRLRKGRVNKTHADNVLLAGLTRDEVRLRARLSVAPKAGFYNDFVGPALDGIVLLEAVRQVMRAISTEEAVTGDKSRLGLLRQLEVALDRPIRKDESVEFSAGADGSMVVGGAALLSVQGDILAPGTGQRIGRFSTSATQITQELQRAWSQSMTGTRDWNA